MRRTLHLAFGLVMLFAAWIGLAGVWGSLPPDMRHQPNWPELVLWGVIATGGVTMAARLLRIAFATSKPVEKQRA